MFEYDPHRTAIIGIDLQNWTVGMPVAPRSGDDVVSAFVKIARALKAVGGAIVLTRAAFSPDYADLLQAPVDVPLHLPEGGIPEASLAFKDPIAALNADIVFTKRSWSAFYGTELDLQLRRRNINTVIVGGVMTNFGVESTARDAWQHNYATLVAEDASASLDAEIARVRDRKALAARRPRAAPFLFLGNASLIVPDMNACRPMRASRLNDKRRVADRPRHTLTDA